MSVVVRCVSVVVRCGPLWSIVVHCGPLWSIVVFSRTQRSPIHTYLLKELPGVQKQTTNLVVLLEVDMVSLSIYEKKNCFKNWERIAIREKENALLHNSYN